MIQPRALAALLATSILVACGGGGTDDEADGPPIAASTSSSPASAPAAKGPTRLDQLVGLWRRHMREIDQDLGVAQPSVGESTWAEVFSSSEALLSTRVNELPEAVGQALDQGLAKRRGLRKALESLAALDAPHRETVDVLRTLFASEDLSRADIKRLTAALPGGQDLENVVGMKAMTVAALSTAMITPVMTKIGSDATHHTAAAQTELATGVRPDQQTLRWWGKRALASAAAPLPPTALDRAIAGAVQGRVDGPLAKQQAPVLWAYASHLAEKSKPDRSLVAHAIEAGLEVDPGNGAYHLLEVAIARTMAERVSALQRFAAAKDVRCYSDALIRAHARVVAEQPFPYAHAVQNATPVPVFAVSRLIRALEKDLELPHPAPLVTRLLETTSAALDRFVEATAWDMIHLMVAVRGYNVIARAALDAKLDPKLAAGWRRQACTLRLHLGLDAPRCANPTRLICADMLLPPAERETRLAGVASPTRWKAMISAIETRLKHELEAARKREQAPPADLAAAVRQQLEAGTDYETYLLGYVALQR